jgi:hypothetical protein
MYISPVELRAFQQDAEATNRQTARMEKNAGYTVERNPAAQRGASRDGCHGRAAPGGRSDSVTVAPAAASADPP